VEKAKQVSVASLPEDQQDAAMDAVHRAIEAYPAVLVEGHLLHVCELHGEWEVWVNTEDAEFTGLCVSAAPTRDEAVSHAVKVLEAVVAQLQQPAVGA
jgi:hypothetical protein